MKNHHRVAPYRAPDLDKARSHPNRPCPLCRRRHGLRRECGK